MRERDEHELARVAFVVRIRVCVCVCVSVSVCACMSAIEILLRLCFLNYTHTSFIVHQPFGVRLTLFLPIWIFKTTCVTIADQFYTIQDLNSSI